MFLSPIPLSPPQPSRHARLFELIRQENLALRHIRRHREAAPDSAAALAWIAHAERSLRR